MPTISIPRQDNAAQKANRTLHAQRQAKTALWYIIKPDVHEIRN